MINRGDKVRKKYALISPEGTVIRINWDRQAEVLWNDEETTSMHDLFELELLHPTHREIESMIPQSMNMTQVNGKWVIAKPIASYELGFFRRIKNAWLVLTGKAFIVRWY